MKDYINTLENTFEDSSNPHIAGGQKAYMRNQFEFFGLTTTKRREIQKPFLNKNYLPEKHELENLVIELWQKPQRDFQYFCQELAFKYIKQAEEKDIELYEYMVMNRSWWDTVDYIANKLMGEYFKTHPQKIKPYINKWLESDNIWLQRSALLFQLKYKEDLDKQLLTNIIHSLLGSKEFFINKAIGWTLREYSRTDPEWVIDFVEATPLNSLSKREALRIVNMK